MRLSGGGAGRRTRSSHSDTMSPPAEWPYTRIFAGVDDPGRPLQFGVVAGQAGGEVRRLALPPRPAALVQV